MKNSNTSSKGRKKCCKYHDNFNYQETDLQQCGWAGMGATTLCCPKCPEKPWYDENQPTRPIEYYVDDIKKGLTFET